VAELVSGSPGGADFGILPAVELQTLKRLIGRCNPREPLEHDDERYVDVDHIAGEAHRPRRLAWVDELDQWRDS